MPDELANPNDRPAPPQLAGPTGILNIDKPLKLTSMDVCRRIKRRLIAAGAPKRVKVGHGGTLDPLATGVLVVLIGKATKLCEVVMAGAKSYETEIDLSAFSTTDDAEGERTSVELGADGPPSRAQVEAACAAFVGTIMQRPPIYSAIKVNGQEAYKLARKGQGDTVELAARPVRIDSISVVEYAYPRLVIYVDCGKGVYIRSLARDLGVALGTGGMLTGLRRTRVGHWTINDAVELESLPPQLTAAELLPIPAE